MTELNIQDYIAPGRRAHLVGIGGVSMSPLAEVLHGMGMVITGSDMRESPAVDHLRAIGIPVEVGQRPENLGQAGRISGVSPADVAALMVYLHTRERPEGGKQA